MFFRSANRRTCADYKSLFFPPVTFFGSAQFFLETNASSLLYSGDFKLRPGRSAEPTEWKQAETLIMETTYGLPRYVFRPPNWSCNRSSPSAARRSRKAPRLSCSATR
jgi:Cft2 family RNA processing exonuclease